MPLRLEYEKRLLGEGLGPQLGAFLSTPASVPVRRSCPRRPFSSRNISAKDTCKLGGECNPFDPSPTSVSNSFPQNLAGIYTSYAVEPGKLYLCRNAKAVVLE